MTRFKVTVSDKQRRETGRKGQACDACDFCECACDVCACVQERAPKGRAGGTHPQPRGKRTISPLS